MAVWLDTSVAPPVVKPADANLSLLASTVAGIALNGGSVGQPIQIQTAGNVTMNAVLTAGAIYVLSISNGAGGIAPAADLVSAGSGTWASIIGIGNSTTSMQLVLWNSGVAIP